MNFARLLRSLGVFKQILYARITGKRIPIRIALQLTTICNMRCSYCYVNFQTYNNLADLPREEMFAKIDELYALGTRWLWFLGGEPMVRKDFGQIIDYAQRKGMFCDMNTNGVLINERNIDIVKKLDAVCISIDGDEESNDYYRGKGNYQKAMAAVRLLRKHNVDVRLHSILTKRTWKTLDHVAKTAVELGASFGFVEVLRKERDDDHVLSPDEEREFYQKYMDYRKKGYPILHSVKDMEYILNWPKKDGPILYRKEAADYPQSSYMPCVSGDTIGFLDIDGRVYSCNGTWEYGLNSNEVGFKKAWDYLGTRECVSCKCIGAIKFHSLFRLDPWAVLDGIENLLRFKKKIKQ